ncbi:MAG: alanyl-tRNA synthetase [Bacillota bacterium]|nr:MAG: alanyl-tRNA synthetase [Bacillota bacterium]
MKLHTANELRHSFLEFFRGKTHTVLPSASLVPVEDPTLLWINSGVATLKPYFSGQQVPPNLRLTSSQKSVRTNDIENVGRTARHHTLFEMLGNFSIGDYFKTEAIIWAWEYLTEVVGFDTSILYITVHPEDDEAYEIWTRQVGVPADRVVKLADNFWDIGPGPCGPNSEICVDRGVKYACTSPTCGPGCDCDRYMELWNLVFSQYNHNVDGTYTPLPRKNIDTGMGLERLVSLVQGAETNYGTDLFMPYINYVEKLAGKKYLASADNRMAMNVIADHVRAVAFAISDGAAPSNEGRGYVIRRLLRRAVRFGGSLGLNQPFLCEMVPLVAKVMHDAYPELSTRVDFISKVVRLEEERFLETLDDGTALFMNMVKELKAKGATVVSGELAFRLYDTFGFPVDLTEDIALENGFTVDREGFVRFMEAQRERARAARSGQDSDFGKTNLFPELSPTNFVGYNTTTKQAVVLGLMTDGLKVDKVQAGDKAVIVLDATPFYAESGGQVGDSGSFAWSSGEFVVENTIKYYGDLTLHTGYLKDGTLSLSQTVTASVDCARRTALGRAHTATHLIHAALKQVLGPHANQAGSLVEPDRLRFDFSHFSALTRDELKRIEELINVQILASLPVVSEEMSLDEARAKGATALFGEKYGNSVRVVSMGDFSLELCGGTHHNNSASIGLCLVLGEGGIGAGLRRIEAVTGREAYHRLRERDGILQQLADELKTSPEEAPKRLEFVLQQGKEVEREAARLHSKLASFEADEFIATALLTEGVKVVARQVTASDMDTLRATADAVKNKLGSGVLVLGAVHDGKVSLVSMVSEDLLNKGLHAGNLIREVAKLTGGGGGGKPNMAQAGGKDPEKLSSALEAVLGLVKSQLR